jgi:hypothetical protein
MSPSITDRGGPPAISRRQYLSRMDRFQHGRSGADFKTMRPSDQPEITPNFTLTGERSGYRTKRPEMLNGRGFQPVCNRQITAPFQSFFQYTSRR